MKQTLTFAVIGCGSRGRTYMRIARDLGHSIAAFADPLSEARETMREISGDPATRAFETGEELLEEPRLADVALVSTQDAQHFEHAKAALLQGYDVLLEKPAATSSEEVEELARLARDRKRKLLLCFVLRYTPFYRALKKAVDDGMIGDLVCINASEGVGPWHYSHSYIRGHWAKSAESTPMIVAKCSHDTDLLHWLTGSEVTSLSSYQDRPYFTRDREPEGATDRCTDGCPHAGTCRYDAHRYLDDQRRWLRMVRADAESMTDEDILEWLRTSDWGRCAWRCDQDAPEHQVVSMQFANGVTATLTMTAFDTGRRIRLHGTRGIIEGATHADGREPWIECRLHEGETTVIPVDDTPSGGYAGHGGGDFGLIEALPDLLAGDEADFIEGHRIAFDAAASAARNSG
ncbi:Gfo/Idh/MocA family protein [Haloferula sp. A504]|uniref:Gfo/Idh/MocA family protein n=1 Tax=Haloferula sp. A504 TaxID=3373601 RepID=UPI0031C36E1A|nr:Gfo/Idh/MocA family oxidoreductase [Verrucomicrobiaceae bacterium E54]